VIERVSVSGAVSATATPQAARGPRSGRENCGRILAYYYVWVAVGALDCGSLAAAFPGRCETVAVTPAGIARRSQELGAAAAAGQSTCIRIAPFDAVLNRTLACTFDARFAAAITLRPNAQVRPELAARLVTELKSALTVELNVRLTAPL